MFNRYIGKILFEKLMCICYNYIALIRRGGSRVEPPQ